ncbi:nuclear transport factor 2 family protein [Ktedonosporobacter rubrisoli]|uniref:Nuclear transport factor 2 family protein n=1 Tax=Ktedonosporobacter rubrisoli TaxID=2509675 RepID=A0A4P6JKT4_KTERU|nr:nuclear transport factor 2 family protein [Ktedonosporobacter rubrisoli]QBD75266.1 nuclear transport factor 2 family protein [Ktedonosporobacter rubrisoli]
MHQEISEDNLRFLLDRASIEDVVTRFTTAVDGRDWSTLRSCLAEEIDLDYTSLHGGVPLHLPIDQVLADWGKRIPSNVGVHHALTNREIALKGDEAICTAYLQAHHFLIESGEFTWTLGGKYTVTLRRSEQGWKICRLVFIAQWVNGDREIIAQSQKRFFQP